MKEYTTPTAADLAFPVARYVAAPGIFVDLLTPYWRQHPTLAASLPMQPDVQIATWKDGTTAAVPAKVDHAMLSRLYSAARIVAELQQGAQ